MRETELEVEAGDGACQLPQQEVEKFEGRDVGSWCHVVKGRSHAQVGKASTCRTSSLTCRSETRCKASGASASADFVEKLHLTEDRFGVVSLHEPWINRDLDGRASVKTKTDDRGSYIAALRAADTEGWQQVHQRVKALFQGKAQMALGRESMAITIGRNGETIQRLRQELGVHLWRERTAGNILRLLGPSELIEPARLEILANVDRARNGSQSPACQQSCQTSKATVQPPEVPTTQTLRRSLAGVWKGSKGEVYEIEFLSESVWRAHRSDHAGSKTFRLSYESARGLVWWSESYFSDLADMHATPATLVWHRASDKRKQGVAFRWLRQQGGRSARLGGVPEDGHGSSQPKVTRSVTAVQKIVEDSDVSSQPKLAHSVAPYVVEDIGTASSPQPVRAAVRELVGGSDASCSSKPALAVEPEPGQATWSQRLQASLDAQETIIGEEVEEEHAPATNGPTAIPASQEEADVHEAASEHLSLLGLGEALVSQEALHRLMDFTNVYVNPSATGLLAHRQNTAYAEKPKEPSSVIVQGSSLAIEQAQWAWPKMFAGQIMECLPLRPAHAPKGKSHQAFLSRAWRVQKKYPQVGLEFRPYAGADSSACGTTKGHLLWLFCADDELLHACRSEIAAVLAAICPGEYARVDVREPCVWAEQELSNLQLASGVFALLDREKSALLLCGMFHEVEDAKERIAHFEESKEKMGLAAKEMQKALEAELDQEVQEVHAVQVHRPVEIKHCNGEVGEHEAEAKEETEEGDEGGEEETEVEAEAGDGARQLPKEEIEAVEEVRGGTLAEVKQDVAEEEEEEEAEA